MRGRCPRITSHGEEDARGARRQPGVRRLCAAHTEAGLGRAEQACVRQCQISDHFAIIPTLQAPKQLNEAEQKLYDMVVRRFLAVFYPAAEYLQTTRITRVASITQNRRKVLQNPAGSRCTGRTSDADNENLPPIAKNEKVGVHEVAAHASQTKPPPRYTEATLLSAMEGAGKLVEDDELRAAMEAKGWEPPRHVPRSSKG